MKNMKIKLFMYSKNQLNTLGSVLDSCKGAVAVNIQNPPEKEHTLWFTNRAQYEDWRAAKADLLPEEVTIHCMEDKDTEFLLNYLVSGSR